MNTDPQRRRRIHYLSMACAGFLFGAAYTILRFAPFSPLSVPLLTRVETTYATTLFSPPVTVGVEFITLVCCLMLYIALTPPPPTTHGSARFAQMDELRQTDVLLPSRPSLFSCLPSLALCLLGSLLLGSLLLLLGDTPMQLLHTLLTHCQHLWLAFQATSFYTSGWAGSLLLLALVFIILLVVPAGKGLKRRQDEMEQMQRDLAQERQNWKKDVQKVRAFFSSLVSFMLSFVREDTDAQTTAQQNQQPAEDEQPNSHGSARFASVAEVAPMTHPVASPTSSKTTAKPPSRLPLGVYVPQPASPLQEVGITPPHLLSLPEQVQESHVLLVAPTGKGKTSGVIIPALLLERGHRSVFINDVKGELIEKCAGALAQQHHVFIFSPTQPEQSNAYNPLAHVMSMEDAEDLAAVWVENTGVSHEEFWNAAAKLLITSTVLHLVETEPSPPFSRVADILCGMSLADMKDLLTHSQSQLARDIALSFVKSLEGNERLASSILVELATRFFMLRNPGIQRVTASNDLHFADLVDTPAAVFLSIAAQDARRLKPLSALLIMQLMNYLTKRAEHSPKGRLPRPFALYLDELANAGKIRNFAQHLSLVRSAGIAVIAAIQDFGQLRREYGDDDSTSILANTTTHLVFPGCGLEETKYYSEKLGDKTVIAEGESVAGLLGFQRTSTYSPVARRLMTPDEIRTMPQGQLLVITDTLHPLLVQNTPYFKQKELSKRVGLPFTRPKPTYTPPSTPSSSDAPPPTAPTTPPSGKAQQSGEMVKHFSPD